MALKTWTQYKLSALIASNALVIGDGYRAKNSELCPFKSGLPFARAGNINSGFQFDDADYLAAENLLGAGEKISKPGDVLFTSKGTVGRVAFVSEKTPHFVYSPQLTWWRVKDTKRIEPRFLYYWMHGREFYVQINGLRGQTDMADYVSLRDQRQMMRVTLPSLDEQKAIAHVLGTLDDKIELNQQMNRTLESIARALFKSWFIDFDPVGAKMDGRQPAGMDAETSTLFPDEFENSSLGKIPKGWKSGVLKDIAENQKWTIRPEQIPVGTPYVGLEHMPKRSIALSNWGLSDYLESNKFQFKQGNILFGKLRPYFHKVGIAIQDGVCSTDILVIVPKHSEWLSLALAYVSSDEFVDHTNMSSDGTRMPRTSWQVMGQYPIAIPSIEIARAFNTEISAIVQKIRSNIFQSKILASIRDALLPKLLAGQVCVKDVEKFLIEERSS